MSSNNDRDTALAIIISQLERIEEKVDIVGNRITASEKVAIQHEATLQEHMRRSDLLEMSQGELNEAVKPILKAYTAIWGLVKFAGAVSVIMGALRIMSVI